MQLPPPTARVGVRSGSDNAGVQLLSHTFSHRHGIGLVVVVSGRAYLGCSGLASTHWLMWGSTVWLFQTVYPGDGNDSLNVDDGYTPIKGPRYAFRL